MNFLDNPQIEELDAFGFFDDEETLREVNEYYDSYDDLSSGLPIDSSYVTV